jgi:hypothetical protein
MRAIAHVVADRVPVWRVTTSAELTKEEEDGFPTRLGGERARPRHSRAAVKIAKAACHRKIVERARFYPHEKKVNGLMIAMDDVTRARAMKSALVAAKVVTDPSHIVVSISPCFCAFDYLFMSVLIFSISVCFRSACVSRPVLTCVLRIIALWSDIISQHAALALTISFALG